MKILLIIILGIAFIVVFIKVLDIITRPRPKKATPFKDIPTEIAKQYGFELHYTSLKLKKEILYIHNPFRGVFVSGGAGSGKSVSVAEPIIFSATKKNYSGILYDFKYPELSEVLETSLIENKSTVKHYSVNFTDLSRSHRVNPLSPHYLINSSYAEEAAQVIINNLFPESIKKPDFWSKSATALLTATIWYLREEHPQYCTLPHVINLVCSSPVSLLRLLSQNAETKTMISSHLTALESKAGDQLAGVVATLQIALSKINKPDIAWVLSGDDFDLNINDPKDPKFLSLGNNTSLSETYSPVISLLIAIATKQMNQPGKHHSVILLDEAPTLYIPKIEQIPATARSNKISLVFMCQDVSQVVDAYGETKANAILSNLNNQLFGRCSYMKSAEYVSRIFGKKDVIMISETSGSSSGGFGKGSDSDSITRSYQERDILKPSEVLNFSVGQFACILVERQGDTILRMFLNECPEIYSVKIKKLQEVNKSFDLKENFKQIIEDVQEILKATD